MDRGQTVRGAEQYSQPYQSCWYLLLQKELGPLIHFIYACVQTHTQKEHAQL